MGAQRGGGGGGPGGVGARRGGGPKGGGPKGGAPKGGAPKGGAPKGGAPKGGAPKGGAPKGGAPKGGGPKGGGPNPEKVEPRRVEPRRVGAQNFALFFPSPATKFVLFFPLWGSSRGILVVFEAPGRSNVHVWSSRAVVCEPRRPGLVGAASLCFKHFSRQQALLISHLKWGVKSRKVLETATRSKKHEVIVESQRLRKANIMEGNAFFSRK